MSEDIEVISLEAESQEFEKESISVETIKCLTEVNKTGVQSFLFLGRRRGKF